MNESSDPEARPPTPSGAATAPVWPSLARVKRRVIGLVLALTASFLVPYLWGAAAGAPGAPGPGWLVALGGGLLVLGAALLALRHAVLPDLDALERTRVELDAHYRSASARARDTNDYLRDVSHEIRASMHAVLGLTQLLSRSALDATQHRQTRTIDGAARALLRIINDLLAFSGPEPHRFDLVPMGCSLHDMLGVSADLLEPSAKDKGLTLELHVASELPDRVLIDVGRVQQVVLGVCRHAIETSERGALRIEARPKKLGDKRFELSLSAQAPRTAAPAAGRNAAVAPELAPASQAGLSLSRRLAELMGGSIQLSEPRGTIELLLPMSRVDGIPELSQRGRSSTGPSAPTSDLPAPGLPSPVPPAPGLPASASERPIRLPASSAPILLVEADERSQVAAVELLENLGFEVEVAVSAARALERAGQNRYALILMATTLPDADGFGAAANLRELLGPRPAIVGCAQEPLAELRRRLDAARLDAILAKPLERAALCAVLAEWLPDEAHPASSGTRLSQGGALEQAMRRAQAVKRSAPASTLPDLAPGQRPERLLELFVLEMPAEVRALGRAVTRGRRDEVAAVAERLAERCSSVGALKMAALCHMLSGARDLSLEQLGANARALGKALEALLVALGEPAQAAESAPASATTDRTPESP